MSPRATYNVLYETSDRERRKKAFIRKRKRMKLLVGGGLVLFALLLLAAIIFLTVKIIKGKIDERKERETYVEYTGDYKDIWLVDNSVGKVDNGTFYEIEEEINNEAEVNGESEAGQTVDPRKEKYKNIVPGSKRLVIVDAGHGGYDGGAEGYNVLEKDLNLDIAFKLKDELILRGYTVYMTRTEDEFVGLNQRASLANQQNNPLCLISIHQNSLDASEGSASGMESWTYDRERCKELGDDVIEGATKKTGARNRGTRFRTNLVVTSKTTMPAIIFECGYVTDQEEAAKLADEDYQAKIVEGIVDGIDIFLENT